MRWGLGAGVNGAPVLRHELRLQVGRNGWAATATCPVGVAGTGTGHAHMLCRPVRVWSGKPVSVTGFFTESPAPPRLCKPNCPAVHRRSTRGPTGPTVRRPIGPGPSPFPKGMDRGTTRPVGRFGASRSCGWPEPDFSRARREGAEVTADDAVGAVARSIACEPRFHSTCAPSPPSPFGDGPLGTVPLVRLLRLFRDRGCRSAGR